MSYMRFISKILIVLVLVIAIISSAYYIVVIRANENTPPDEPTNLIPANAATVARTTKLQWTGSDPDGDNLTYDVYFGTTNPPPKKTNNQTATTYNPGTLDFDTQYCWKIIAWDTSGASTQSIVSEFTTVANQKPNTPSAPHPESGSTDMPISMDISWTGGDPDTGDTVTYDVYFGTANPPSKVKDKQSGALYDPGTLQYTTTYYWMIVAWDTQGASTEGPVWSFTTRSNQSNGGGGTETYQHTVFIEEATAEWCDNCPIVADILHNLYTSGDYRFYYVSLVHDKNEKAKQRLNNDYKNTGFPTVYIDGGYDLIYGANNPASVFQEKIIQAMSRDAPKLKVEITTQWDNTTKKITTTTLIKNGENEQYIGRLKVLLTEQISPWYDYNGVPYQFSFLDYIVDKNITVPEKGTTTVTETKDATGLDPENLIVIGVVFSQESTQKYSDPPDNTHPFDAYYADAANATEVVQGVNRTLPPLVGLEYPKKMRINIFGNAKHMTPLWQTKQNTWIVGRTTVKAYASSIDSTIVKVEFYIDGKLKSTVPTAPYEYTFRKVDMLKHLFRKHTITAKAYDAIGKTSSASIDVFAFFV